MLRSVHDSHVTDASCSARRSVSRIEERGYQWSKSDMTLSSYTNRHVDQGDRYIKRNPNRHIQEVAL